MQNRKSTFHTFIIAFISLNYNEIDDNSSLYGKFEIVDMIYSLEVGVESSIEAEGKENLDSPISTTVAVGVNVSPFGSEWEPEPVGEVAYSEVSAPDWEVEVELYDADAPIDDVPPTTAYALNHMGFEGVNTVSNSALGLSTIIIHTVEGNPIPALLSLLNSAFSY